MELKPINEISTSRKITSQFLGVNVTPTALENEFSDMENLVSDGYPYIQTRQHLRGVYKEPTIASDTFNGLICKDALCYVAGSTFYINQSAVSGLSLTDSPKTLVSFGAYVLIFPDKKYVNTEDTSDKGSIEVAETAFASAGFTPCSLDGTATTYTAGAVEPADKTVLWLDTSTTPHVVRKYSSSTESWITVETTYIRIKHADLGVFEKGDGVMLTSSALGELSGKVSVVQETGKDGGVPYIVIIGLIETVVPEQTLTASRTIPDMDFVCESENRLWGCKYGLVGGKVVNEIYASKLGDFKNFNVFEGTSMDSYAVSVGTDGVFTGAIAVNGSPIFFKENCMHKIYGNYPSNYQVQTTVCRGIMTNCSKSAKIVNGILYYKSRDGICRYDGSLPADISACLGNLNDKGNAIAEAHKDKYYVVLFKDGDGTLYVYDTLRGLWHKESKHFNASALCSVDNELFYIDTDDNTIKSEFGTGDTLAETRIPFSAESAVLGLGEPNNKYVSRIDVRLFAKEDSEVYIDVAYAPTFEWQTVTKAKGHGNLNHICLSVKPKRSQAYKIRIRGTDSAYISSVTRTFERGSDIR